MTQIILIRHGETTATRDGLVAGTTDVLLTDKGRQQASAVAERLSKTNVTSVFASPKTRCLTTAEPFAERSGLEVVRADGMAECDFGSWEGKSFRDIMSADPEGFRGWMTGAVAAPHGGESWDDLTTRTWAWLTNAVESHEPTDTVVVFTHGGVIRCVVRRALAAPSEFVFAMDVDPCSLTLVRVQQGLSGQRVGPGILRVRLVNDTSHLGDVLTAP